MEKVKIQQSKSKSKNLKTFTVIYLSNESQLTNICLWFIKYRVFLYEYKILIRIDLVQSNVLSANYYTY